MKRTLCTVLVAVMVLTAVFTLAACQKNDELKVVSYEITPTTVDKGSTHGKPTVTAHMSDDTTKTVSNNLVFDEEDIAKLELDSDNKYTKAGEFTVKVYIIEKTDDPRFFIGEWKITVRMTK